MIDFFIDEWERVLCPNFKENKSGYKPRVKNRIYQDKPKTLYALIFEDNSVYVGVTFFIERRKYEHAFRSSNPGVRERMSAKMAHRYSEEGVLLSSKESYKEIDLIKKYKKSGFKVLNVDKGGKIPFFESK